MVVVAIVGLLVVIGVVVAVAAAVCVQAAAPAAAPMRVSCVVALTATVGSGALLVVARWHGNLERFSIII